MNTRLRCLLLDDELPGLRYLKMLCEQIPELEVLRAFNSPETFLGELPGLEFDLCILDIEMPGLSGLHIANLLKSKAVIFTTAYKEYAAEAFDLDAVDYVRKPVKMERLQEAVHKAIQRVAETRHNRSFLSWNTDKGKTVLFFDQMLYVRTSESDSRDKVVWLLDGTRLTLKNISFEGLLNELPVSDFCRVNKKEVIALRAVKFFSHDEITTSLLHSAPVSSPSPSRGERKLTLSDVYRVGFMQKIRGFKAAD